MAETKTETTAPCWVLTNDDGPSEEHFRTEEMAADFATRCLEGAWTSHRLDHVCVTVSCEGCGYVYDEEGDGIAHFTGLVEAEKFLPDAEGWVHTPEGWLCQPCGAGECDCADSGVRHAVISVVAETASEHGGEVFTR